jgi:hypothetical protein
VKGLKVNEKYWDKELGLKIIVLRVFCCVHILKYFFYLLCAFLFVELDCLCIPVPKTDFSLLIFYSPVVTLLTMKKLNVLPTQCIYVFCMDLRTNSDYFTVQH